jgi:NADH-quinone oxidoreductase subunit J
MMLDKLLLIALVLATLWTVMTRSLLKAALGLALTSAIIAVVIFKLDSPLAGIFELSVCAGLITAVFVSAISLMKPLTHKEIIALSRARAKRYWPLPLIVAVIIAVFSRSAIPASIRVWPEGMEQSVQNVLWNVRSLDLFGQIVIVLAGVFGTVILFRESNKK